MADSYDALLALAGERPDRPAADLQAATLRRAVPPSALMPRFAAFDQLCAPLSDSAAPGLAAGRPAGRQGRPALGACPSGRSTSTATRTAPLPSRPPTRWLRGIGKLGDLLLAAPDAKADAVLAGARDQIAKAIANPGPDDVPAVLQDEAEALAFWQGSNAHDAGNTRRRRSY